jgi:hypothetical protein
MNTSDLEMMLKITQELIELTKSIQNQEDQCNCHEEQSKEEDSEEKRVEEFDKEYKDMFRWALGIKPVGKSKKSSLAESWRRLHPEMPALFVPINVSNETAHSIILMQIIPHWILFKKNML